MATTRAAQVTRRARRVRRSARWRGFLALALLLGLLGGALPLTAPPVARAAVGYTLFVTSTADTVDEPAICTLRDALNRANDPLLPLGSCRAVSGGEPGITTVAFDLPAPGPWTITLAGQLPTVGVGLTLDGPGADRLTIRRDAAQTPTRFRLLDFDAGAAAVTIRGVTLTGGDAVGGGGGLRSTGAGPLTVTDSILSGNTADDDGGGFSAYGPATVTDSTFSSNTAEFSGGGFFATGAATVTGSTLSSNTATYGGGGGFYAYDGATVASSTLSGNTADGSGGGFYTFGGATGSGSTLSDNTATRGGGFYAYGGATVRGSTLSGNSVDGSGGGFFTFGGATVSGSTLSGNAADDDGGGFVANGAATVTNSLFAAGATGANCATASGVTDDGGNVSSDASCVNGGTTSLADTDPLLGSLADNGGPTRTHAPQAASPARGLGVAADCAARATDQRGLPRPATACDSGAVQVTDPAASPTPSPSPSPTPSPSATPSPSPSASPAPAFADVPPGYWAHDQIISFAQRGITTGCGDDDQGRRLYCPERGVTRAEMAVFLTRVLGQDQQAPPAAPTFADVPADHWAYAQIEAFVKLGITTGCGTDDLGRRVFCPDRGVTRAEMAAFLDRAKGQGELVNPTPTFADVPTNYWAYGWIERFFTLGVTTGCGEDDQGRTVYCPDRGVTRAEMAVFIIRAYP